MNKSKTNELLGDTDVVQRIKNGESAQRILFTLIVPRYGADYISDSHFRHLVRQYRLIHGLETLPNVFSKEPSLHVEKEHTVKEAEPAIPKKKSFFQRLWHSDVEEDEHAVEQLIVQQSYSEQLSPTIAPPITDKKVGKVHWRDLVGHIEQGRDLSKKASWSQDYLTWELPEAQGPVAFICISDFHFGARSTDHSLILQLTDEILSIPELYVFILGDMTHMAIKLRGVAEVADNAITPEMQMDLLESWLEDIGDRVVCSTWDNHAVEREEKGTGVSLYKRIFNRKVAYHNGIGHVNVKVGSQVYKIAVSHTFRGRSIYNPIHAQQRYMKFEAQDREIALAGDSHVPGIAKWSDGPTIRMAINTGSTQLDSGYARRYFSLKTQPIFPCFTLDPDEHLFTPFWSINEMLKWRGHIHCD